MTRTFEPSALARYTCELREVGDEAENAICLPSGEGAWSLFSRSWSSLNRYGIRAENRTGSQEAGGIQMSGIHMNASAFT
jgi:hypothetical protein